MSRSRARLDHRRARAGSGATVGGRAGSVIVAVVPRPTVLA